MAIPWGLANAAATLVGQNLGAKKEKRAEKAVWLTAFYAMIFLGLVSVVYIIWAPSIIGIFTADTGVLENGIECLTYLSIGYIFFAYGMVVTQAFNGAGDTRTPTLMNLFIFWMIQIPLAYLLANRYSFGPSGVYLAIIVSESVLAFVAIYLFRRGRWKQKVV